MKKNLRILGVLVLVVLFAVTAGGCGGKKEASPGKVLQLTLDGPSTRQAELQAVSLYLKQVGIDAQVRVWEKNALEAEVKNGSRQAYSMDWGSAIFDPFDLAVPKLKTKDRGNFSFYSNPKVDDLLMKGASGATEEERRAAYMEAQKIIYQDCPWIFGYSLDIVQGVASTVEGYKPFMDNRINLHDVYRKDGSDTLVVGLNIDHIITLDPANYRDRETETVIRNIFDGLVTRTTDGKVAPEIAESWSNPQPNVYEFKIRKGIKFQNEDPLTPDDVVFTFERIMSPTGIGGKQSPRLGLLGPLDKVEKAGPDTVRFTMKQPSPQFLQLIVHTQIVPMNYVKKVGDATFAQKPVGAGPFKLVSAKMDSEVVLERFDGYYGGSPDQPPVGPAKLKKVVFRMLPEPSTRVTALKAGEVQIIEDVPADVSAELEKDANTKLMKTDGTRAYMIELNNQQITDPRVRQALNYAVNWNELLGSIYKDRAHRLATAFLPSGFGFNNDLKPYGYNPEKAKQLLKEAGYKTP